MERLENYALGQWVAPSGDGTPQYNAITGELIAVCGSDGLSFADMADYARSVGNTHLRKMSFQERGIMLKKLALYLNKKRLDYYPVSYKTGATKADSWIDIDGGIGTLFAYASLRKQFPNTPYHVEGELANLSREGSFIGHHIMVPKRGVAVHINAFNFPIWGMLEKCAVNWLAGMPAIVKAAEPTFLFDPSDGEGHRRFQDPARGSPSASLRVRRGHTGTAHGAGRGEFYGVGEYGSDAQVSKSHHRRGHPLQYGGRQPQRRRTGRGCRARHP